MLQRRLAELAPAAPISLRRVGPQLGKDEVRQLKARAEQGDPEAQNALADCYVHACGVGCDCRRAARWYQKAMEGGCAKAFAGLAKLYLEGWDVPRDPERALELYAEGADLGDPKAQHGLASCYAKGLGGDQDIQEAMRLYAQAAQGGIHDAACDLMQMLLDSSCDAADFARALALLEQAADARSPSALRLYAKILLNGWGVKADPERAVALLERATFLHCTREESEAHQESLFDNISGAWGDLGLVMCRTNLPPGVADKARAALSEGCELGSPDAMRELGSCLLFGHGADQDFAEAQRIFARGAALSPSCRACLGAMIFWGLGCERDPGRGMQTMAQAFREGALGGAAFLYQILAKGAGGWPADEARAERLRKEAERLYPGRADWERLRQAAPVQDSQAWLAFWSS